LKNLKKDLKSKKKDMRVVINGLAPMEPRHLEIMEIIQKELGLVEKGEIKKQ